MFPMSQRQNATVFWFELIWQTDSRWTWGKASLRRPAGGRTESQRRVHSCRPSAADRSGTEPPWSQTAWGSGSTACEWCTSCESPRWTGTPEYRTETRSVLKQGHRRTMEHHLPYGIAQRTYLPRLTPSLHEGRHSIYTLQGDARPSCP